MGSGMLLDVALNFGSISSTPAAANWACTICHVVVKEGEDSLSERTEDELDRLDLAAA